MAKFRLFGNPTADITNRELLHREIARQVAAEGMVLLKNDGALPLKEKRIAAYGAGVRMTIKGGTGSGDVQERYSVNVESGVKNAGFELEIIPGITSFCAAADKAQISLCEGNESVAIIPSLKSNLLEKYIADFDTVVIMKSGNDTDVIYDILKKYRLENNAIVSSCIGMENEIIEKIQKGKSYGYFTTVIVRK